MAEHARLSPSNHRWPNCPGSVREEANYKNTSGAAAIDGTKSHVLLEISLRNDVNPDYYEGLTLGGDGLKEWEVDSVRCDRVQMCTNYVKRREKELKKMFPGCTILIESESISNPGHYFDRSDWWGTCDVTIIVLNNLNEPLFIEVIDYKDGQGYVSEKWNTQLISYLFGKLIENHYDEDLGSEIGTNVGIRMTIVQPKTSTPIRYMCSTNKDDHLNIETFFDKVKWLANQAKMTDDQNAPLIPGKHCRWCKHNPKQGGTCDAQLNQSMGIINNMVTGELENGDITEILNRAIRDVKSLKVEELSKLADAKAGFLAAFDNVFAEIDRRVTDGILVPGYKKLPGRKKKIWNDTEEVIVKKLKAKRFKKDEIYPSKLVTPAAALANPKLTKIQKDKLFKELIKEVSGDDVLTKVEYDIPTNDVEAMFANVNEKKEISFL